MSAKPWKKLKRYDTAGHAHELTSSCYHRFDYLNDTTSCLLFLEASVGWIPAPSSNGIHHAQLYPCEV